jgi:hypothetical protein
MNYTIRASQERPIALADIPAEQPSSLDRLDVLIGRWGDGRLV